MSLATGKARSKFAILAKIDVVTLIAIRGEKKEIPALSGDLHNRRRHDVMAVGQELRTERSHPKLYLVVDLRP